MQLDSADIDRGNSGAATAPSATVRGGCVVCGTAEQVPVCSADSVAAQQRWLQRFHRRRLRRARRGGDPALADRADFTQDDAVAIVACAACRHVYRAQRPRPAEAAETYAEDHYGAARLAALFDSQLEQFRGKVRRLRALLDVAAPRIVEVGSFVGGFLAAAGEQRWSAVGIDPGEAVGRFCRAKGLRVEPTTAPEAAIASASADCVAIWNTFDQLPDPRPTLAAALRWLRPGGLLVVRVPNGDAFRGAWQTARALPRPLRPPLLAAMAWNNLLTFPYLQGYTVDSLDRLLGDVGAKRIALDPDVLTRLADAQNTAWAAVEERVTKQVWGALGRLAPRRAPWFDAYYRGGDQRVPALCPRKTIDNGFHGFPSPACGRNQTESPPQRCSGGL
ncbi:MAG TPA: methyltransferase domain-containing protein [Candidatus Dormibacteraeota bacterium]|nr:methyltransferase domain-containing protein [Candidatus Dormibacteraeota bacterium]